MGENKTRRITRNIQRLISPVLSPSCSLPPSLTSLSVASIMPGHCHRHHHAVNFNNNVQIESKGEEEGGREEGVLVERVRRRRGSTLKL